MSDHPVHQDLLALAGLYGILTSYHDVSGKHVEAGADALLGVLKALEAPVDSLADVPEALRARQEELAAQAVEPVVVAWDGRPSEIRLRLRDVRGSVACHLDLEGGERRGWMLDVESLPQEADGTRKLVLPEPLPHGYHHLRLETGGRSWKSLLIAAPTRAYTDQRMQWGVFLPLYALHTERSWGAGDFSDLETLAEWTSGLGGGLVATLPLLAAFLDEPCEPSPYAPASRLFWNEMYIDPRRLPELEGSPAARRLLEAPDFQREIEILRSGSEVDYRRLMALKRRVLEELAHRFFAHPSDRLEDYEEFIKRKTDLEVYAAFRAVGDRRGETWQCWPERLREGTLAPADSDEEDRRYYLWTQWAAAQQMAGMAHEARRRGPGLYLDLPLGVHGSAFDVWRHPHLFAQGAAAGAPPDSFFTQGQNWGFPPLKPESLRESGYDHLIACLRHHLEHAGVLRIDHVMQLHRLFWIPQGMAAKDGVYVRYPAEELYAILSLESHRHQAMIVGENLGTVPPEVYEAMDRHEILGMYVVQYELQPGQGVREPPARSVASLNTHDMPTFRSYWEGRDVGVLRELGFFNDDQARSELERRDALRRGLAGELPWDPARNEDAVYDAVLLRLLEYLASSPARMVLVNLEDLWREPEPQNVPGTSVERPNWRRKARPSFEEFSASPAVVEALRKIDELRRRRS